MAGKADAANTLLSGGSPKDAIVAVLSGIVVIGMITAFAIHSKGLSSLVTSVGQAGKGLMSVTETGA